MAAVKKTRGLIEYLLGSYNSVGEDVPEPDYTLESLIQEVSMAFPDDPRVAGVTTSYLPGSRDFYMSVVRYRQKFGEGKEVFVGERGDSLKMCLVLLGERWRTFLLNRSAEDRRRTAMEAIIPVQSARGEIDIMQEVDRQKYWAKEKNISRTMGDVGFRETTDFIVQLVDMYESPKAPKAPKVIPVPEEKQDPSRFSVLEVEEED